MIVLNAIGFIRSVPQRTLSISKNILLLVLNMQLE